MTVNIYEVFSDPRIKNVFIPLFCILATLLLKVCSKKKMHLALEDWAFGLDILVTAIAILFIGIVDIGRKLFWLGQEEFVDGIATDALSNQMLLSGRMLALHNKLILSLLYLLSLTIVTFFIAMVIRGFGWTYSYSSSQRMNFFGIFGPACFSIVVLFLVAAWV